MARRDNSLSQEDLKILLSTNADGSVNLAITARNLQLEQATPKSFQRVIDQRAPTVEAYDIEMTPRVVLRVVLSSPADINVQRALNKITSKSAQIV